MSFEELIEITAPHSLGFERVINQEGVDSHITTLMKRVALDCSACLLGQRFTRQYLGYSLFGFLTINVLSIIPDAVPASPTHARHQPD